MIGCVECPKCRVEYLLIKCCYRFLWKRKGFTNSAITIWPIQLFQKDNVKVIPQAKHTPKKYGLFQKSRLGQVSTRVLLLCKPIKGYKQTGKQIIRRFGQTTCIVINMNHGYLPATGVRRTITQSSNASIFSRPTAITFPFINFVSCELASSSNLVLRLPVSQTFVFFTSAQLLELMCQVLNNTLKTIEKKVAQ